MFKFIKSVKVSNLFSIFMVVIFVASCCVDIFFPNEIYWFQRSGALIVLAGVGLQYSKLVSLWKKSGYRNTIADSDLDPETPEHVKKIGGTGAVEKAAFDLSVRNHDMITSKSLNDKIAFVMMVLGTLVWAYGDILFHK